MTAANDGSTARHIRLAVQTEVRVFDKLGWELNDSTIPSRTKQRKTRVEGIFGYEWSEGLCKMVHKEWLMDRRDKRYRELVRDPDTGEVTRFKDEPLTQHTGRGSAKKLESP